MRRILGVYTNCFGPAGVRGAAEHARGCGFDHLELALKPHDLGGLVIPESAVVTPDTDPRDVSAFVDLLAARGVSVSGCNVGGGDLRTPEGVELTERRIRFARAVFGVSVVVSGAGQPENDLERALILRNLARLGDVAESLGVTIALETHKGPTQNAEAMSRLMRDLGHPHVRLNFDTGNIGYYNRDADVLGELERVAPWVRNVHLKDSRGRFEDWYFPALGDGGWVDFARVRDVLDGVGFAGPYTLEIEGIAGEPEPGLEGRLDRIRRSAEHLRACGFVSGAPE